jgi:hypothetical protein
MSILGGIINAFDGTGDTVIVIPATSAAAYEPYYLLSQITTVDGSGSDLDADLLDGYHASYFGTAVQVTNLQNTDISLQNQINGIFAVGSRLVFRENFTGNGSSTSIVLTGALQNAGFSVGSWSAANILTALQVDITDLNGKPIYDSVVPIYRDRINVTSVDSLGNVTLNFAPLNGQQYSIWYWYQLQASNVLSYYYREDHVAAMEGDGVQMASSVDTDTTAYGNIVLRTTDNTVQKSLNRLDQYVYWLASISGSSTDASDTTLRSEMESITGSLQTQINSINVVAGSGIQVVESPVNTWTISTTISGGGSGFTPIEGVGINITPVGADYSFAVEDYIGKTEVASISGSLQNQINAITFPTSATFINDFDSRYINASGDTMTGNLVMSGASIQLDIALDNPTYQEGRIFYDNAEKALSYYTDINGVTVNVGQEHLIKVKNVNGSSLADGDVVYVFSADGNNVTVKKARADLAATSRATIGVVTQACADGESTYITRLGKVHGLNTNAYNEGDTIYLSHTVAGGWTTTLPPAPNRTVRIGYISKKSAGDGHILVDVHDGLSLTEVNDVWITSVANRDLLSYNSANSRWENTSVVAATSGALDSRYTLLSTTASISGNLQSQINLKQNEITLIAGSNVTITESPADTWTISATSSSSAAISGGVYQGIVTCDTTNASYRVTHPTIDLNYSFPTVSLIVPTSGSNLFVHGITNRTTTTFDVTLSEVPNVTGYYVSWHLPSANSAINTIPVVNLAITNIPSYTTTVSGSYNVSLSESVVYAEYDNTVTLPASPTTNESHWIVNIYTSDITIDGNGKNISLDGVLNATLTLTPDSSLHLHFNSSKDRWYVI